MTKTVHGASYVGAGFAVFASIAALTLLKHTKGEIIEPASGPAR